MSLFRGKRPLEMLCLAAGASLGWYIGGLDEYNPPSALPYPASSWSPPSFAATMGTPLTNCASFSSFQLPLAMEPTALAGGALIDGNFYLFGGKRGTEIVDTFQKVSFDWSQSPPTLEWENIPSPRQGNFQPSPETNWPRTRCRHQVAPLTVPKDILDSSGDSPYSAASSTSTALQGDSSLPQKPSTAGGTWFMIHGGWTAGNPRLLGDTWLWCPESNQWYHVGDANADKDAPFISRASLHHGLNLRRCDGTAVRWRGQTLLLGGMSMSDLYDREDLTPRLMNDCLSLEFVRLPGGSASTPDYTLQWEPIPLVASYTPRMGHNAIATADCIFLFGGKDAEGHYLNDLWCGQPVTAAGRSTAERGGKNSDSDSGEKIAECEIDRQVNQRGNGEKNRNQNGWLWQQCEVSGPHKPTPRYGAAMVAIERSLLPATAADDGWEPVLMLSGGVEYTGRLCSDVWMLEEKRVGAVSVAISDTPVKVKVKVNSNVNSLKEVKKEDSGLVGAGTREVETRFRWMLVSSGQMHPVAHPLAICTRGYWWQLGGCRLERFPIVGWMMQAQRDLYRMELPTPPQ